jgi:hypothetical protein
MVVSKGMMTVDVDVILITILLERSWLMSVIVLIFYMIKAVSSLIGSVTNVGYSWYRRVWKS